MEISLFHPLVDGVERGVGADRRWAGLHHLLGGGIGIAFERLPSQAAEKDAADPDHEPEPVWGGLHPWPDFADPVTESAGHGVVAGQVPGLGLAGLLPLRRQPAGKPVDLARDVVVDPLEAERLEPARGPWAEVS
jgi:hypothetical protein